jgi:hypothetical protein
VHTDSETLTTSLAHPPGSPERPPTREELERKVADCLVGLDVAPRAVTWDNGAALLRRHLPAVPAEG